MVYYLKINRKEEYTVPNLQNWIDVITEIPDSQIIIICDDDNLRNKVIERIRFHGNPIFIESIRENAETKEIVKGFASERWENAGYAHLTTFYHARVNGYKSFWNIDADDTFICLPANRLRTLLSEIEKRAINSNISIFSLDMWYTKSQVNHWTFGVSYIDNTIDWIDRMRNHLNDSEYKKNAYPPNMDGYFTYLRDFTDLKLESFYAENLRFMHYSNDFFRRPWASGFYHWKNGVLDFPILRECYGIDNLGAVTIPNEVIRIDIGISDDEARETMIETCYRADQTDIKLRYKR